MGSDYTSTRRLYLMGLSSKMYHMILFVTKEKGISTTKCTETPGRVLDEFFDGMLG